MAAIGRRSAILSLFSAALVLGDQSQDALRAVNAMSTALSDNDPVGAMAPFDKEFSDYNTLAAYFGNLTASFLITNEADVLDESDEPGRTVLTFDWTITLRSQSTDETLRRREHVKVVVIRRDDRWKILSLSPISIFSPQV